SADGLEAPHVDIAHARLVRAAPTERVFAHADDGVVNVDVAVDGDVLHVDDRGAVDDDVVDDARPAPAGPPRAADEARRAPPRNHRLAPAERDPADERRADRHAHAGRTEERDEGGRVHGTHDDRARRPGPVAVDEDPTTMVVWRPAPRRLIDPGPAIAWIGDPASRAVGRPATRSVAWHPHRAIRRNDAPVAVVVEVVDTVHTGRHVPRAARVDQL